MVLIRQALEPIVQLFNQPRGRWEAVKGLLER